MYWLMGCSLLPLCCVFLSWYHQWCVVLLCSFSGKSSWYGSDRTQEPLSILCFHPCQFLLTHQWRHGHGLYFRGLIIQVNQGMTTRQVFQFLFPVTWLAL